MSNFKRFLIRLVTFLAGLYFVLKFVLPKGNGVLDFDLYHEQILNGFMTVSAMAVGLGLLNLFYLHGSTFVFKRKGWVFSAVLLSGLLGMIFIQGADWLQKSSDAALAAKIVNLADFSRVILADQLSAKPGVLSRQQREKLLIEAYRDDIRELGSLLLDSSELVILNQRIEGFFADEAIEDNEHREFQESSLKFSALLREQLDLRNKSGLIAHLNTFMSDGLFVAMGSAMFALLGFYIAAAAYRAFRVRSIEAALMMISALIVMLGQIPFGMWISPELPGLRLWLLQVPSAAAARAIEMGAAIAGLVLAVRMWLSLESDQYKK